MEEGGQKLKRVRERLGLKYREVEEASNGIAQRYNNDEFSIALSRLADIENKGTVPTIYRIFSLCAIYRLDPFEVMQWYGVDLARIPSEATHIEIEKTHPIGFGSFDHGSVQVPLALDPGIDLRKTTHLSRLIQRWGSLPVMLLSGLDLKNHRYGFIGTEDWSMFPILMPGSLILIDETRRKPVNTGWTSEWDRPIYLLEHRDGFACGWVAVGEGSLTLVPHPSSQSLPEVFAFPSEVDVIGQVLGVAMRLDPARRRRTRS
jgi:transcriptional regulator with XRE-family HTH domain